MMSIMGKTTQCFFDSLVRGNYDSSRNNEYDRNDEFSGNDEYDREKKFSETDG